MNNKRRVKIDLKVRRCTRCGHWECPHCRTFCDDGACIFDDGPCSDGSCCYDSPIDTEGYKRFDEQMRFGISDDVTEDGMVFITVPSDAENQP